MANDMSIRATTDIYVKRDFYDRDEYYGDWYMCPECSETMIIYGFKYCPNCGVKFIWHKLKLDEDE